jgi:thiol-disulfide isomerase/thioredoxin
VWGAALDLAGCGARASAAERTSCVAPFLSTPATATPAVAALERLVDEDPEGVARVAKAARKKAGPDLEARLLALEGRALLKLGKNGEAAKALGTAIGRDDGTTRVRWLGGGGSPAWTRSLDLGDRRIEWAARSFLAAGRNAEARDLLTRALGLGSSGWTAEEGWRSAGGGPIPGIDAPPVPVLMPRWFDPLPDLAVKLLDGGELPLRSHRGKVLLLDFWASWCGPCLEELPHLEEIYAAEAKHGLVPIAVNADEPVGVAREAARTLGIDVPVALYDPNLDRQFSVRVLPTVILIDRQGRIRARFDGYYSGMEKSIATAVRQLLSDDPHGAPQKVGESIVGGAMLEATWSRDFGSKVGGVAVVSTAPGKKSLAVTAEGQLLTLDPNGAVSRRSDVPPSAGRLEPADLDGDGRDELLSYRATGSDVVIFDLGEAVYRTMPARAPVLGVAHLPAEGGQGRLVLATTEGPQLSDTSGIDVSELDGPRPASAVAVVRGKKTAEIVVVGPSGELRWIDPSGETLRRAEAPAESFRLVVDRETQGVGVAPPGATASATGRFLGAAGRQAAIATSGQLLLLDLADGAVRVRLRWQGITDLSAGDLDGDGTDELVVAWDRSIAVLRAAARPPAD